MEELVIQDGQLLNGSFTDYLLPTALDVPRIGWRRSSSDIPTLRTAQRRGGAPRSPPRRRSPPPCGPRRAPASRACRFARSTWSPKRTGLDGRRLQPARSGCRRRAARVLLRVDRVGDERCRRVRSRTSRACWRQPSGSGRCGRTPSGSRRSRRTLRSEACPPPAPANATSRREPRRPAGRRAKHWRRSTRTTGSASDSSSSPTRAVVRRRTCSPSCARGWPTLLNTSERTPKNNSGASCAAGWVVRSSDPRPCSFPPRSRHRRRRGRRRQGHDQRVGRPARVEEGRHCTTDASGRVEGVEVPAAAGPPELCHPGEFFGDIVVTLPLATASGHTSRCCWRPTATRPISARDSRAQQLRQGGDPPRPPRPCAGAAPCDRPDGHRGPPGRLRSHASPGRQHGLVATDSQKNIVYGLARSEPPGAPESFALRVAGYLVDEYESVDRARVDVEAATWVPLQTDAFRRDGGSLRTRPPWSAQTESGTSWGRPWPGPPQVRLGVTGFLRDRWTTLPETDDRILASSVRAGWRFSSLDVDFDEEDRRATDAICGAFAGHHSESLQQTLRDGDGTARRLPGGRRGPPLDAQPPPPAGRPVRCRPRQPQCGLPCRRPSLRIIEGVLVRPGASPADSAWRDHCSREPSERADCASRAHQRHTAGSGHHARELHRALRGGLGLVEGWMAEAGLTTRRTRPGTSSVVSRGDPAGRACSSAPPRHHAQRRPARRRLRRARRDRGR